MIDYLIIALKGMYQRKLRSFLTILGIIIGISVVFIMISISKGANQAIKEQFEKFGYDKIMIIPGGTLSVSSSFDKKDLNAVKKIGGVEDATGIIMKNYLIEFENEKLILPVFGISRINTRKIFEEIEGFELEEGRYFRRNEKFVVILGYLAAKKTFSKEINVGDYIYISGRKFRVIGILKRLGNRMDDASFIVPIETMIDIFNEKEEYSFIIVKASGNPEYVAEKIKKKLESLRGKSDFSVLTAQKMSELVSQMIGFISLVLTIIAGISLLVGSISVMNTMYMAVLERTRQIGVMKAIGAKNYQIFVIFLFESGIIGLFGGTIGTIIGYFMGIGVENVLTNLGYGIFKIYIDPLFVGEILLFSFFLGAISGIMPAYRASKLNPIEALRYE